ncbi:MAG: hypothetical protein J6A51_04965 [Clostridia bacterium]|nr:hypothetical protein [Clostridia bacterium]
MSEFEEKNVFFSYWGMIGFGESGKRKMMNLCLGKFGNMRENRRNLVGNEKIYSAFLKKNKRKVE